MRKIPEMIFIIDTNIESLAVNEAKILNTNCSCFGLKFRPNRY